MRNCRRRRLANLSRFRAPHLLSSFGGEGQGEEVVVLSQPARYIGAATHWNVSTHISVDSYEGPPLPNPLLQRRRTTGP